MYHSCTSKTTSLIKTIKGASPLPTLRLEEGDCAPIFVQLPFSYLILLILVLNDLGDRNLSYVQRQELLYHEANLQLSV